MKLIKNRKIHFVIIVLLAFWGCKKQDNAQATEQSLAKTPVKITHVQHGSIAKIVTYNGYASYLRKETVRSPITGYIQSLQASPGSVVNKNQLLGRLQTQEARVLANVKLKTDSFPDLSNLIVVKSPTYGIINTVNYQEGAFVQQGDQLMDIVPVDALVFIINVPYEDLKLVKNGMSMNILLPDGKSVSGTLGNTLPGANSAAQIQRFILHPDSAFYVPDNLNVTATFSAYRQNDVQVLRKEALLTNEVQTDFWVMKLINDTTAVKVDVKKGIESGDSVEIMEPQLSAQDRLLYEGHYGLPDTAYVKVIQ